MNTKSVYQLDEEGYLVGQTIAFESPLEPSIFHIPRGCVDTDRELPKLGHFDDRIKWSGTEWIVCNERVEKEKLELEEIQKIEDEKKRQEELQKLEEEKQRQILLNKKSELEKKLNNFKELERLEKLIKENNELNNLSQGQYDQIQTQIAELKNTITWQH